MGKSCDMVVSEYKATLSDYGIIMTPELEEWIRNTYPDVVTIDSHIKNILMTHMNWRSE